MSYSRWSSSCWYSFWAATESDKLEDQLFSLWYSLDETYDWTYTELRQLMSNGYSINDLMSKYGCTEEQAKEAILYIEKWFVAIETRDDNSTKE
jgi:hypothetical protein